jgi:maltose alpha-D-glucosyltransferase/alpha-amylase
MKPGGSRGRVSDGTAAVRAPIQSLEVGSTLASPAGIGSLGASPADPARAPLRAPRLRPGGPSGEPQWYRDAVIYEVHVRAFKDSNGDGRGDFRGLTSKLDYLRDLGVTALWLLPFYPSPLRDDGYDIADYTSVNPSYGTLRDVETLIRETHKRGLRIITELVCNHTSDQHPWFQRARHAKPGSAYRDYYVWSNTPDKYADARIIFKDFEASNWTWDPVAGAYYWHRFYSHQPDLNFDNPRVRKALTKVLDFWLDRGVDGLRLDAVPYLFEREGTDCENLPETHAFLRELRSHVDERYQDRMLLAEANQWPEQSAAYFGDGDECHMAFNFPVMPRMFMAIRMEDRLPVVDIVEQTPAIPEGSQWALFLRNHDELTLEMVTDEERDYMYRVYAGDPQARINLGIRRRLAPLLGNHRRRIELMNGLLFSLPGTPFIYYGDEIGMGDNVYLGDRDSVRTPMQWNGDRNAGFSTAPREQLYLPVVTDPEHHFEAVNVSVQQANPHSLLWWMKRLIALRKKHPAFGRGDLEFLHPENRHVLAFLRCFGDETILVAANLSRFFQPVELNLADYEGRQPIEMFGRVEFPAIGQLPYLLTLGPHEFLWFTLEQPAPSEAAGTAPALATLPAAGIADLLDSRLDRALAPILVRWVRERPWYRGHGRKVKEGEVVDRIEVPLGRGSALIVVLQVSYTEGEPETYLLPITTASLVYDSLVFADGYPCHNEQPGTRIASLATADGRSEAAYLVDALPDFGLTAHLIDAVSRRRRIKGSVGELVGLPGPGLRRSTGGSLISAGAVIKAGEVMGQTGEPGRPAPHEITLELRRALEPGADPETEVMKLLAGRGTTWSPRLYGELVYRTARGRVAEAALVREGFVHDGDVVSQTREALLGFLEQAATIEQPPAPASMAAAELLRIAAEGLPEMATTLVGSYLETARSLGRRVAEFHALLASASDDPTFAPEPFTRLYQASLFQSIDSLATRIVRQVRSHSAGFEPAAGTDARRILGLRAELKSRLEMLQRHRFSGARTRVHGAMHLATVLRAERGLVMIDFEGDTSRPSSERRLKRSPLRDVAAMIRSFHDVALGRLRPADLGASLRPEDAVRLDVWARHWYLWVSAAFLAGYRETIDGASILPATEEEWACLLDAFLIQEALEDLYSDLRSDLERVPASMRGVVELLGSQASGGQASGG